MNKEKRLEQLDAICEYSEQYLALLKDVVNKRLFSAQKYRDKQSYEDYVEALKLHNMLKHLLDLCDGEHHTPPEQSTINVYYPPYEWTDEP